MTFVFYLILTFLSFEHNSLSNMFAIQQNFNHIIKKKQSNIRKHKIVSNMDQAATTVLYLGKILTM